MYREHCFVEFAEGAEDMGATKHSAYRLLMRELRVQRNALRRALELATADVRITKQPDLLRLEINTFREALKMAAREAYGREWECQYQRLLAVGREESQQGMGLR